MFIRTTLHAGAPQSCLALPSTYCEFEEPSNPCSTIDRQPLRTDHASGCQWQWHNTWLGDLAQGRGRNLDELRRLQLEGGWGRGRKLPKTVCRWALVKPAAVDLNGFGLKAHLLGTLSSACRRNCGGVQRTGRLVFMLEVDIHFALPCELYQALRKGGDLLRLVATRLTQAERGVAGRPCAVQVSGNSSVSAIQSAAL